MGRESFSTSRVAATSFSRGRKPTVTATESQPRSGGIAAFLLTCLFLALLTACGAKKAEPLRVTVRVPIEDELSSPGHQNRTLPWDSVVLKAEQRFTLLTPAADAELAAPLVAGKTHLEARDRAIATLAENLGGYLAAQPPPGEVVRVALLDFAESRPALDETIRRELQSGWNETVTRDGKGNALLTLQLPLDTIAKEVLLSGGGFTEEDEFTRRAGARSRAQKAAYKEASETLLKEAGELRFTPEHRIADWIAWDAQNASIFSSYMLQAKTEASEEETVDGQRYWKAVISLEPEPLLEQARGADKRLREQESRGKSTVTRLKKTTP